MTYKLDLTIKRVEFRKAQAYSFKEIFHKIAAENVIRQILY